MIDAEGFRPNVGIIITDGRGRLLWARRHRQDSWQFPQGGIHAGETPEDAMFRELHEEVGLNQGAVRILGVTRGWLRYRLPKRLLRHDAKPLCIGQKQRWFLLQLVAPESAIQFDVTDHPEFDHWQWVNYWYPLRHVVSFKREVYRRALKELLPLLFSGTPVEEAAPRPPRERDRRRRPRPRRERRGGTTNRPEAPRSEPPERDA
ncbi:MAG: RNA pyrophosphohydrolase [Gammaproteobacteria bacterium]|nr:RNA pyrophosphohydrolase [Gammaproteobacteria bacterium]